MRVTRQTVVVKNNVELGHDRRPYNKFINSLVTTSCQRLKDEKKRTQKIELNDYPIVHYFRSNSVYECIENVSEIWRELHVRTCLAMKGRQNMQVKF